MQYHIRSILIYNPIWIIFKKLKKKTIKKHEKYSKKTVKNPVKNPVRSWKILHLQNTKNRKIEIFLCLLGASQK